MRGFEIVISSDRTDYRGVAILFNNNFDYEILQTTSDEMGNQFLIDFNLVQDTSLDYNNYKHIGNPKAKKCYLT